MRAAFISDVHLHPARPQAAQRFLKHLAGPAREVDALYILGDLFDAWAGDDDLDAPFNAAVVAALRELSEAGVALFLLRGNRDFLLGAAFACAAGATLIEADEHLIQLEGAPTLLLHGDTLCTDDLDYQNFRALVRSPRWQAEFLARPLTERRAEIERLRALSEAQKRAKPMPLMDANASAIAAAFARHSARRIIHGHTHRPARHDHGAGLERWVLPEWSETRPTPVLTCIGNACRWA